MELLKDIQIPCFGYCKQSDPSSWEKEIIGNHSRLAFLGAFYLSPNCTTDEKSINPDHALAVVTDPLGLKLMIHSDLRHDSAGVISIIICQYLSSPTKDILLET